jgi:hypothetical protein
LKLTIAWVFSFITFIGVMSQARDACAEAFPGQSAHSTITTSQEQHQSFQHRNIDQGDQQDSNCHHSGSGCRNCHLGHCAFTLGSSILFSTFNPPQLLTFTTIAVIIFDFQTSLFRPPIA